MSPVKQLLSVPQALSQPATRQAGDRVYRKDAARVGRYYVPHAKAWADISADRIDHWVEQFGRYTAAGNTAYFTVDHGQSVEHRRGRITGLSRDGDRLMFDVQPDTDEAAKLIEANPQVSIQADTVFTDSTGARYEDVITAISAVLHPVISDQTPFVKLSVDNGKTVDQDTAIAFVFSPPPSEIPSMFTPEQVKQMRLSLKVGEKVKDEDVAKAIVDFVTTPDDSAAKLATAEAKLAEAEKTVLSLKSQVASGQKPDATIDPDIMEQAADIMSERLSLMIQSGKITPAIADKVRPVLVGTAGNRPALMLSQRAASAAGLAEPVGKLILSILDTLEVGVKTGQKTGPQTFSLQRETPDSNRPTPEAVKAAADAAWAGRS